ncbi:hypothetical protein [Streptomyces sp. TLI_171]|uniref:hypothetical protein n=1 Tax=Streptomyces sp. TLI_171 TaxID=1938859 RepID=UPI000C1A2183|nr:hypothetical protein [Streptomyces sp. TLI_171]RKE02944.1 hypothetical protein BX266_7547 [Streptomyces sp. TLI_171]
MFRLIRTRALRQGRLRLLAVERELADATANLAVQTAGWEPPQAPIDGDVAAVLRHVDAAVREEAVCRAADYAEQHLDPTHSLGLTLPGRWSGYPDGSAVHYLGAGRWLYYHPGHAKLHTIRSHGHAEFEQVRLIDSRPWESEPVANLPALLELLDGNRIAYHFANTPQNTGDQGAVEDGASRRPGPARADAAPVSG